jgi:hypothetical protein
VPVLSLTKNGFNRNLSNPSSSNPSSSNNSLANFSLSKDILSNFYNIEPQFVELFFVKLFFSEFICAHIAGSSNFKNIEFKQIFGQRSPKKIIFPALKFEDDLHAFQFYIFTVVENVLNS